MLKILRKGSLIAATVVAVAGAAVSLPSAATAGPHGGHGGGGHWHGGGGHGGWGWGGFGLGLGTGLAIGAAPYYGGYYGYGYDGPYAYDDGPGGCYIRRRLVHDGYGHRYWRRVRVCY